MKFKLLTDQFSILHGYTGDEDVWEECETQNDETPLLAGIRIISNFNRTLKKGEKFRKLIAVYVEKEKSDYDIGKLFLEASNLLFELNDSLDDKYDILYGSTGWRLSNQLGREEGIGNSLNELIEMLQQKIRDNNI